MKRLVAFTLLAVPVVALLCQGETQPLFVRCLDAQDARPILGATLQLRDAQGHILSSARTDEGGSATLPLPPSTDGLLLQVSDDDQEGSIGEYFDRVVPLPAAGEEVTLRLLPNRGVSDPALQRDYTTFLEFVRRNLGKEPEALVDSTTVLGPLDTLSRNWGNPITIYVGSEPNGTSGVVSSVVNELNAGLGFQYLRPTSNASSAKWVFDYSSVDFRRERDLTTQVSFSDQGQPKQAVFRLSGRFLYPNDLKTRLRRAFAGVLLLSRAFDPRLLDTGTYDDHYFEVTAFSYDFLNVLRTQIALGDGRDYAGDLNEVNRSPVANPGPDLDVRVSDEVTVSSARSMDSDGRIAAVEWSQVFDGKADADYRSPNEVSIADKHATALAFTPQWPGNYRFLLTVCDDKGATNSAAVDVRVRWDASPFQIKGLCEFARYFDDEDLTTFVPNQLRDYHDKYAADWIEISPYWWMESSTSNSVHPLGDWYLGCPGYTIAEPRMARFVEIAHSSGLKVFLRPTLEFHNWAGFRGDLNPADWKAWFASYREFVVRYASLAEAWGVEMFSVGNELHNSEVHTQDWKDIIAQVRRVYSGTLTYTCTGMYLGASKVAFWDKLDVIGVDYYPPITGSGPGWSTGFAPMEDPPFEAYVESIRRNLLQYVYPAYVKYGKPVLISETGCPNYEGVNHVLTGSPESLSFVGRAMDNTEQTHYLESILQNAAASPWISGVFVFHNEVLADYNYQLADIPIGFDIKHRPSGAMTQYWFGEAAK